MYQVMKSVDNVFGHRHEGYAYLSTDFLFTLAFGQNRLQLYWLWMDFQKIS